MALTTQINAHDLSVEQTVEKVIDVTNEDALTLLFDLANVPLDGIRCRVYQAIENVEESYDIARYENGNPMSILVKNDKVFNIALPNLNINFIKVYVEGQAGILTVKSAPISTHPAGYDSSIGGNKSVVLNPDSAQLTSPIDVISITNAAIGKYFKMFTVDEFRNLALQINGQDGTGLDIKVYETLDKLATEPATGGEPGDSWIDITAKIFGGALNVSPIRELEYIKGQMPEKYLIEYSFQSAFNALDVLIRKF